MRRIACNGKPLIAGGYNGNRNLRQLAQINSFYENIENADLKGYFTFFQMFKIRNKG